MVISMAGGLMLAGAAAAQSDVPPSPYGARNPQWTSSTNSQTQIQSPPQSMKLPPPPPPLLPKTFYYKKEAGAAVKPAGAAVKQAQFQVEDKPAEKPKAPPPDAAAIELQKTLEADLSPPINKLTRLESEKARMVTANIERNRTKKNELSYPDQPPVSTDKYKRREYTAMATIIEPHYVCYGRLYFEEKNSERYGWELGPLQPAVSALYFAKDVAFLPYKFFSFPCRCYDCSTGYCMPGDPVPYYLYPPGASLTGLVGEAATIGFLVAILP